MTKEERNSVIDEALVVVKASFDHNLAMVKLYSPPFVEADPEKAKQFKQYVILCGNIMDNIEALKT